MNNIAFLRLMRYRVIAFNTLIINNLNSINCILFNRELLYQNKTMFLIIVNGFNVASL